MRFTHRMVALAVRQADEAFPEGRIIAVPQGECKGKRRLSLLILTKASSPSDRRDRAWSWLKN